MIHPVRHRRNRSSGIPLFRWLPILLGILSFPIHHYASRPEVTRLALEKGVRDYSEVFRDTTGRLLKDHVPGRNLRYEACFMLDRPRRAGVLIRTNTDLILSGNALSKISDPSVKNWDFHFIILPPGDSICLQLEVPAHMSIGKADVQVFAQHESAYLAPYLLPFDTLRIGFFLFGFLVFLVFLSLVNIAGFVMTRRMDYLYYSLYSLAVLCFFLFREIGIYLQLVHEGPSDPRSFLSDLTYDISRLLQPASYLFYALFARHFLDTARTMPRLDIWLSRFVAITAIAILVLIILLLVDWHFLEAWTFYRFLAMTVTGILTVWILRSRVPLAPFVGWGSGLLLVGGAVAMVNSILVKELFHLPPMDFMKLGFLLEFLLFSLGMARKTALTAKEKLAISNSYNQTLERLNRSESLRKQELEKEVERISLAIREEITAKTKAELDLRMAEQEMKTLMNQLNPHFVFNCMNALKWHVYNDQPEKASELIDRLAQLIRTIHMFSRESSINLRQEIESLELYVSLENERLRRKIALHIEVSEDIQVEREHILPLLLQPLVENAIWHGLVHGSIPSPSIRISFSVAEDRLEVQVRDNGIGREAARKKKQGSNHLGIATDIIRRKLEIHNGGKPGLDVVDLKTPEGNSAGTEVRVRMKRI